MTATNDERGQDRLGQVVEHGPRNRAAATARRHRHQLAHLGLRPRATRSPPSARTRRPGASRRRTTPPARRSVGHELVVVVDGRDRPVGGRPGPPTRSRGTPSARWRRPRQQAVDGVERRQPGRRAARSVPRRSGRCRARRGRTARRRTMPAATTTSGAGILGATRASTSMAVIATGRQGDGRPAHVAEVAERGGHVGDEVVGVGVGRDAEQLRAAGRRRRSGRRPP